MQFTRAVLILCLSTSALTWHSQGHMLVADIAAKHLAATPNGAKSLAWANSLLRPFSQFCGEKYHPFTECATWPDKIKEQSWATMFSWHFQDQELLEEGFVPEKKKEVQVDQDVVWAIQSITKHLSSMKEDPKGKSKSILGKSLALRNLIHFVGDIHQPLHTVSRVSKKNPKGDLGANLFKIKRYPQEGWNNLHFVWDHLFDQGSEVFSPLTQAEYASLSSFSEEIMAELPYEVLIDEIEGKSLATDWAKEGYEIARDFVYVGLKEGEEIPLEYEQQGKLIVRKRLALGGYRLANRIHGIYMARASAKSNDQESLI